MQGQWPRGLKERLEQRRDELNSRLERITANVRRSLDSDSEERAKQLEDSEVVDALGNEARDELKRIALQRIQAYPYATACIDCAELDEQLRARDS